MRISPFVEADGTASPLTGMLTNKSAVARPPAPPPLALFSFLSFQRQRPRAENPDSQHARDDGIRLRSGAANSPHHLPLTHTHITVCCMRHAARGDSHRSSRDSTTTGPDWNIPPPRGDSRSIMESHFFLLFPNGNQVTTSTCKTMSSLPQLQLSCLQVVPPTPKK